MLKAISIPHISDENLLNTITVAPPSSAYYYPTLHNMTRLTGNNEKWGNAACIQTPSAEIFINSGSFRITNIIAPRAPELQSSIL
jgi:hypothetical protein